MLLTACSDAAGDRERRADDLRALLPAIDPAYVALNNRLAVPRAGLTLPWRKGNVTLTLAPATALVGDGLWVRFAFGSATGRLRLPVDLAERIADEIGLGGSLADETPEAAALLLEYALLPIVERLEASDAGASVRVSATTHEEPAAGATILSASLRFGDAGVYRCGLELPAALAERLADVIETLAPIDPAALAEPVLSLAVVAGRQRLPLAEIGSLRSGDVVLFADAAPTLALGDDLAAPVQRGPQGFKLTAGLRTVARANHEDPARMSVADEGEGLETVPIGLVFELGRIEMPLAEVRKLGPGSLVALEQPVEDAVDIVVNGRRIGRGSLVRIGDGIGVRVTQIVSRG